MRNKTGLLKDVRAQNFPCTDFFKARKSAIEIFVFAILISTLWKFYRANKKNLSYTL